MKGPTVKITKRRTFATLASAALLTTGVGIAASPEASASPKGHTWKFVAISGPSHSPSDTTFVSTDTDRSHGNVVGYDTISGRFNVKTRSIKIYVAVSRKGGLLYATLVGHGDSTELHGWVTGGAGAYRGAEGWVKTTSPSQNSNKTYVTVHYHF